VAADVRAGRLQPARAVHQIVEATLERLLSAGTPVARRDNVRQVLEDALSNDPALRARLARLGIHSPSMEPTE
jgi:hypothetical protein